MQGPDPFLLDLGISLPCAVQPDRQAVLDADHRVFVNYEAYFVSGAEELALFQAKPYDYVGLVTDPVTRRRFAPNDSSPRRDAAGRIFYFESAETIARFDAAPEEYSTPMFSMMPVSEPEHPARTRHEE